MLNAKHKLRWDRARVAVGLVCVVLCLPIFSSAQASGTGDQSPTLPAATPAPERNRAAPQPTPDSTAAQSHDAVQDQSASPTSDGSSAQADQSAGQQVATNLETG